MRSDEDWCARFALQGDQYTIAWCNCPPSFVKDVIDNGCTTPNLMLLRITWCRLFCSSEKNKEAPKWLARDPGVSCRIFTGLASICYLDCSYRSALHTYLGQQMLWCSDPSHFKSWQHKLSFYTSTYILAYHGYAPIKNIAPFETWEFSRIPVKKKRTVLCEILVF